MIGNAIASLVGNVAGSAISNKMNYSTSKKMFELEKNWEKEKILNSAKWTMQNLREAGINPLLASGNVGSAVGSGAPSGNVSNLSSLSNLGSNFMDTLNSTRALEQKDKELKSQSEVNEATAQNQRAQAGKNIEETKYIEPKAKQDMKESNSNIMVNTAKAEELKTETELKELEIEYQNMENLIKETETEIEKSGFGKALAHFDRFVKTLGLTGETILSLRSALTSRDKNKFVEIVDTFRDNKGREVQKVKRRERKK